MLTKEYFGIDKPRNFSATVADIWKLSPSEDVPYKFLCGVEIECEDCGNKADHFHGKGFTVDVDHSLRNDGREIKTNPIEARYVIPAIKCFMDDVGDAVSFGKRTSIHFHLDCTTLTFNQITAILYLYILFEKSLFRFTDPSREMSVFCLPIQESDIQITDDVVSLVVGWKKYSALNLKTISSFGTMEFRHLEGTSDTEKIGNWFQLISALYVTGKEIEHPEILLKELCDLNTNSQYHEFALRVFGPKLVGLISSNLWEDMEEGVKLLKMASRNTFVTSEVYANLPTKSNLKIPGLSAYSFWSMPENPLQTSSQPHPAEPDHDYEHDYDEDEDQEEEF